MNSDYVNLAIPRELRDTIKELAKAVPRRSMIAYISDLVEADKLKDKPVKKANCKRWHSYLSETSPTTCYVSDFGIEGAVSSDRKAEIVALNNNGYLDSYGIYWDFAIPVSKIVKEEAQ